jgi:phospholipase/lecithinase/hemolysin
VNAYALQFNAAAKDLLQELNAKLPGARMSLSDCYSIVMELIDRPQKYGNSLATPCMLGAKQLGERMLVTVAWCAGFKTSHTSCCDVDTSVGGLCLPTATLCADRKDFVFWDAYHTSDAANQIIADRLFAEMVGSGAVVPGNATSPPRVVRAPMPTPTHVAPPRKP